MTVILPGDELVLDGRAIDVSGGGMRVAAASDLAPGQDVALRFTLPAQSNEVRVRGRVVTSFFDAASGKFAQSARIAARISANGSLGCLMDQRPAASGDAGDHAAG